MVLVSTVEVVIAIYFQIQRCLDVLFLVATNGVLDEFGAMESLSDMLCACSNKSLTMLLGKKMLVPWC